jgi:hypothetical protein
MPGAWLNPDPISILWLMTLKKIKNGLSPVPMDHVINSKAEKRQGRGVTPDHHEKAHERNIHALVRD